MENAADHMRRKPVLCRATMASTVAWNVEEGAWVDAGQVVGSVGLLQDGTHAPVVAPCRGTLRIPVETPPAAVESSTNTDDDEGASTTTDEAVGADTAMPSSTNEDATKAESEASGDDAKSATITCKDEDKDKDPSESNAEVAIAFIEYCSHPLVRGRTCLMCLAIVEENEDELDDDQRSVNVLSDGQMLRLNAEQAKKFDSATMKRQLSAKKLSLVLDLDHTLLHAVRAEDVEGTIEPTADLHVFYLPGAYNQQHVVRLRPGLQEFLTQLAVLYDLFIYTHGTRVYAEEIAKIIDPQKKFFQNRIVARTDTPDMQHKSLKLLFPSSDDSMILVLDDRLDVWKENEGNVILIEAYHHFNAKAEINNASGRSVVGICGDDGVIKDDQHLMHTMRVLKCIHQEFYGHRTKNITVEEQMSGKGSDVKRLLTQHKATILSGCHLVFSGLFPLQGPRKPQSHYLWRLALELGATPSTTMKDFPITHLVIHPGRLDTQKHVQAKRMPNVHVVTPEWMLMSARIWERVPESDFDADQLRTKQAARAAEAAAAAAATVNTELETSEPKPESAAMPSGEANPDTVKETTVDGERPLPESCGGEDIEITNTPDGDPTATESDALVNEVETVGSEPSSNAAKDSEDVQVMLSPVDLTKVPTKSCIFSGGNAGDQKVKKHVRFHPEVDAVYMHRTYGSGMRPSKIAPRSAHSKTKARMRFVSMKRITRDESAEREKKRGVVAQGGTFDFLSKITNLGSSKREYRPVPVSFANDRAVKWKRPIAEPIPEVPKAVKPPAKDMDDAFLRLIEAEEEENAQEAKRKRSSTDIRNQLATRRKRIKLQEEPQAPPPPLVTAVATEVADTVADEADDDDDGDDLADLEDDILGAL